MTRPHLQRIPEFPLPEGVRIRNLTHDEGAVWLTVWQDAEDRLSVDIGQWESEFAHAPAEVARRCFVATTATGTPIATASAWMASPTDPRIGRVHWVATRKAYQRRGIARAMLTHTLKRLASWHETAILETQNYRLGAIRLYLDFGFVPDLQFACAPQAWPEIARHLDHPSLHPLRA